MTHSSMPNPMPSTNPASPLRISSGFLVGILIGLVLGAVMARAPSLITWIGLRSSLTDAVIGTSNESAARVQAWMAILQTALQAVTFLGGAYLTYWLYVKTSDLSSKLAKFQFLRSNYDAWKDLDIFLLSHPEYLELAATLDPAKAAILDPTKADSRGNHTTTLLAKARKKHLAFLMLNPYYSYFYAIQGGHVTKDMEDKFDTQMKQLIADNDVFELTQHNVFVEGFKERCKKLKAEADEERPPSQ